MHVGVACTVAAADATRNTARLKERFGDAGVRTCVARQHRARGRTELSAVQVSANAVHKLANRIFGQARIRACRTDLRAVETGLNAFGKLGSIEPAQVLRV